MAKFRVLGLEKIEIGNCGADGAMGSSLTEIKKIVPESVIFDTEKPEVIELFVEGVDAPDIQKISKSGLKAVSLKTRDLATGNLELFDGGTTETGKYSAPVQTIEKYQSVKVTGKYVSGKRGVLSIPRALVIAKITMPFHKGESGMIEAEMRVATPENATGTALSPWQFEYEDEPA
jgi:hypothetical protein